jgi:hypothetical protein
MNAMHTLFSSLFLVSNPGLLQIGPRLVAWKALLKHLYSVQITPGPDEFRWNVHANGAFSVDSLYKAILQSDIPVNNNKKVWKMKIPLKTKKIVAIFVEE